ncbi:MAG: hypothetical protein RBR53_00490 [Desulforegulaceae bacterium]|nr:hypothetical protein [Desulforegulaceae bacterium]
MKLSRLFMSFLVLSFLVTSVEAAPKASRSSNTIRVVEPLTEETLKIVKTEAVKIDPKRLEFNLNKVSNSDIVKICSMYPKMNSLVVSRSKDVTDISPIAQLKSLKSLNLSLDNVKDFTPLSQLVQVERLTVGGDKIGPDLKWMSGLVNLSYLHINGGSQLISLEGLPSLPGLTRATIGKVNGANLTPITISLPSLTKLELTGSTINDLTPLTKLADLKELSLYGANVKDFTPLKNCSKLKTLNYYATKNADYSSLGQLKQVTYLKGGLTSLSDISFVAELPNLKRLDVFAEYITDYSPLAKTNIERLQIWNMRKPVGDLASVGQMPKLTRLKLWSVDYATNTKALAGLSELKEFTITSDFNNKSKDPFDMDAAKGWDKVEKIDITKAMLINGGNLSNLKELKDLKLNKINESGEPFSLAGFSNLPKLSYVSISSSNVKDIGVLKSLPNLKRLTINKVSVPEADLQGFAPNVKVTIK